ncbi:unnamed protein product, partial [Rotaria magnacalcarata]
DGVVKHSGELWKHDDCQSCLCSRGGGKVECFSQTCDQNLPCSNPILKKGQCCPFCLPPTAAVAVCIFNYVQYRSVPISQSRYGLTIAIIFCILILILIFVILILIFVLLRGRHRSLLSTNQLTTIHHRSPTNSHRSTVMTSKPSNIFSYVKYDLMSTPNDIHNVNMNAKQSLSSSRNIPLSSVEQTSTHSMIETNTTTIGTSSSHNEIEPVTWTEDDVMLPCSASTSNDDDEEEEEEVEVEHEVISSDNDVSHQQQLPHTPVQIITGPPTIIYV